jgi:hypothetical protein
MAVAATDIVVYGAANRAQDNTSTQGGAIDTTVRYVFDSTSLANALNDTVEVLSSAAGDTTQTVTITGRTAAGVISTDPISLNGTTPVSGAVTFERILKIVVSGAHTGTITVRKATGDTTIVAIETGILEVRRLFYDAAADATGGSSREFHEKIFVKNIHATLALLGATFEENADPGANITFALEDAVNDSGSVANRLTAPSAGDLASGGFSSSSKLLSTIDAGTADLGAGVAIGVWVKLTLAAGASAAVNTWTLRVSGTSI